MSGLRLALLNNPEGGYNRRAGLQRIEAVAAGGGVPFARATTPDEIRRALRTLAAQQPDILAVNGGDGTVVMVIEALRGEPLFASEPVIAPLRGGTTNMIHHDLGQRARPAASLSRLIRIAASAEAPRLALRRTIEVSDGEKTRHGFFFAAGALPRIISSADTRSRARAVVEIWTAARTLARLFLRRDLRNDPVLRPDTPAFTIDGVLHGTPHVFAAVTTLRRLILGIRTRAPSDGLAVLAFIGRRLRRHTGAQVTFAAGGPWILDGEMHPPARLDIAAGAPVRFWTGA